MILTTILKIAVKVIEMIGGGSCDDAADDEYNAVLHDEPAPDDSLRLTTLTLQ